MNLQFYLEKLNDSEAFREFMKENPTAYLCSGFFVIDNQSNNNQKHLDFYIPKQNKMFSFKLESGIEKIPVETITEIPEKISEELDFELDEIERLIVLEMNKRKINNKIQKILLSLQRKNNKDFLVGSVFISALGIVRIDIDIKEKKIILFEKKSFFDMISITRKE